MEKVDFTDKCIKCTSKRQGLRIINYLISIGGDNFYQLSGSNINSFYFIDKKGRIYFDDNQNNGKVIKLEPIPRVFKPKFPRYMMVSDNNNVDKVKMYVIADLGNIHPYRYLSIHPMHVNDFNKGRTLYDIYKWQNAEEIIKQ